MDLLLLFLLGIVISEYTEKKSKVINIVNSIVFIIFSILIFYGSDNPLIMYAAQNTMKPYAYSVLHSVLRSYFVIGGIQYSSYFSILFFLFLLTIAIGTFITYKIVKYCIDLKKKHDIEKLAETKKEISQFDSEIKNNKLYLVFGRFLS